MVERTLPILGKEARTKILNGVNKVVDVVAPTLGPAGQSVLLSRTFNRGPRLADDGFMAAENVLLKDPHERLAADFFKEGIKKTNMMAGDGTTTTAVLSGFLVNKLFGMLPVSDVALPTINGKIAKPLSARALRKEVLEAKDLVLAELKKMSKTVKTLADLENVARISIGDDELAKMVAKVVWDVARDANGDYLDNHIEVVEGYKGEVEVEQIRGMRFPAKVGAPAFVNKPERHEMLIEDSPVLITNYKMDNPQLLLKILNETKPSKLAIFAPEFTLAVLQYMADCSKKGLHLYPIKAPALRTAQLEDLAVYTAAKVIDKETGMKLEAVRVEDLGFAEKIVVKSVENREDAALIGGRGEKIKRGPGNLIDERLKILKGQQKEVRNEVERVSLEKRIANLGSAIGIIRVGASTTGDSLYTKLKIEDGVYACKGALEEGYVAGGGLALKAIAKKLPKNILSEMLEIPHTQIQDNAGGDLEMGKDVIDPTKVVRLTIEHGVSIAATLITAHAVIPEAPERTEFEGLEILARAFSRSAYYQAKHQGMIAENEDEAERDRQDQFDRVMIEDRD